MKLETRSGVSACLVLATMLAAAPAIAQVTYAHPRRPPPPIDFFSPYDESYGTSPSYEIQTVPGYGPVARVVERCQYPDGWNVTDFGRDVNGIPNGLDHTCPVPVYGARVRSRY